MLLSLDPLNRKYIPNRFNIMPIAENIETAYPSTTNRKRERTTTSDCITDKESSVNVWLSVKLLLIVVFTEFVCSITLVESWKAVDIENVQLCKSILFDQLV